jgi:hypothetical protein
LYINDSKIINDEPYDDNYLNIDINN